MLHKTRFAFCNDHDDYKARYNCFERILAIRKKLYGDPVYKQNVADIRTRNNRLKRGWFKYYMVEEFKIKV